MKEQMTAYQCLLGVLIATFWSCRDVTLVAQVGSGTNTYNITNSIALKARELFAALTSRELQNFCSHSLG